MHPIRLTNKQIQDTITALRRQLKTLKSTTGELELTYKLPEQKGEGATIEIKEEAWQKLTALVDECSKEIAWHGTVTKEGTTYTIHDIVVFPQTVTGATVTSDPTEYSMWLMQQPDDIFNSLRFHGHSHVNMGVRPSGVDMTYQEDVLKNLKDFYIFAIFNKRGENWCTIYDVEDNIVYNDSDITIITPGTSNKSWAKAAIETLVKQTTPVSAVKKKPSKKEESKSITDEIMKDYYDVHGSDDGYTYFGGLYG